MVLAQIAQASTQSGINDRLPTKKSEVNMKKFDFYKSEDYYRRRPHALHTVAAETLDENGNYTATLGATIKPIRTPYGRLKGSSKSAKLGYYRPKDLYFDETTGAYYEIVSVNDRRDPAGNPVGNWYHVFKPATGTYNCRFTAWTVRRGFSACTIQIENGAPTGAYVERGAFEGETIAAGDPSLAMLPIMCGIVKAA